MRLLGGFPEQGCAWFRFAAIVILAQAIALAQQPSHVASSYTSGPDNGAVSNGSYTNEFLGFSYPVPDGWQVISDKATHLNPGGLDGFILLTVDPFAGRSSADRMVLSVVDARSLKATTQHFVHIFASTPNDGPGGWELLRDPFPVSIAGKEFVREDYKESFSERIVYKAFVCTKLRGFFVGWTMAARSAAELDSSVNSLQRLSFQKEDASPSSKLDETPGTAPESRTTGIVAGATGSVAEGSNALRPLRMRVSRGVAQSLLLKKIQPIYPDDARRAGLQGDVVLKALINTNGDVKDLTVVSGDSAFAPAALEAVKQWKYRPYLLNSQPVELETQITVSFQLTAK